MQVQRAQRLGALHQTLGIPADNRIYYQMRPDGITIVDLNRGVQIDVGLDYHVSRKNVAISPRITELLAMTDDQLKRVWNGGRGWDGEREFAFTELVERGVNMLADDVR